MSENKSSLYSSENQNILNSSNTSGSGSSIGNNDMMLMEIEKIFIKANQRKREKQSRYAKKNIFAQFYKLGEDLLSIKGIAESNLIGKDRIM
jgi:hypothetical protein